MLFSLMVLLADVEEAAKGKGAQEPSLLNSPLLPLIGIGLAFYFLLILPAQRKERKQRETLFAAMKKNDEVVTAGGIIGVVQSIKDDEVVIKIDDNAKMRVVKSSISRIIPKDAPATTPPA